MRKSIVASVLLLCCGNLFASDIRINGPTEVPQYELVRLTVQGLPAKAGAMFRIRPLTPTNKISKATTTQRERLEFVGPPGVYEIELVTGNVAADGVMELNSITHTVTILGTTPTPVPPAPVPPAPNPFDPTTDPIWADISRAYIADGKPTSIGLLAALYKSAAQPGGTVDNKQLATLNALFNVMNNAGQLLAPSPALAATREVIAKELDKTIGVQPSTPLDDTLRSKVKDQFTRMAKLLEALR